MDVQAGETLAADDLVLIQPAEGVSLDEAEAAVERGLEIRPKSPTLLKVLDAARLMRYDPTVTVKDEP